MFSVLLRYWPAEVEHQRKHVDSASCRLRSVASWRKCPKVLNCPPLIFIFVPDDWTDTNDTLHLDQQCFRFTAYLLVFNCASVIYILYLYKTGKPARQGSSDRCSFVWCFCSVDSYTFDRQNLRFLGGHSFICTGRHLFKSLFKEMDCISFLYRTDVFLLCFVAIFQSL